MFHGSIVAGTGIRVEIVPGFPGALDDLAERLPCGRNFLRAAWYEATSAGDPRTVLATRADGSPVAAIPTASVGPPLVGARSVPGSYWPFRSILIAADAHVRELTELLSEPAVRRTLSPVWRVGPVLRDDPASQMLKHAAADAGWTVLVKTLGQTWELDLAELVKDGAWPRKSTRRRMANYERQLGTRGPVEVRFVTGSDWNSATLEKLAAVESNSWVGKETDGSGAKFLSSDKRELWHRTLQDPQIAKGLSATILAVAGEPAAFSFDLRAGAKQYSIASSYDDRFAFARVGKIVTYRQLEWAAAQGVEVVDLGAGDSGYKREMGARAGSEVVDLLLVRNRSMAKMLSLKWGAESELARGVFQSSDHARRRRKRIVGQFVAAGAIAGTAIAASE